jgi:hypothetical protein
MTNNNIFPIQLIGTRAERLAWIFCVVDRASVDRTLYNTDKNIEGSMTGFQDTVSGGENSSDKQDIEKHAVAERKRVFEFTSREELGRFPILLKGLLLLSLLLLLSIFIVIITINSFYLLLYSFLPLLHIVTFVVDEEEWLDFLELTLADWLEQVEGAAEKVTHRTKCSVKNTVYVCV